MLDKHKVEQFWKKRTEIKDPRIATHYKHDDTLKFDLELIFKHIHPYSDVLDLGCGTGAIVNELEPHVSKITAVDK
jgi:methylase of polypeptide subunit release factors